VFWPSRFRMGLWLTSSSHKNSTVSKPLQEGTRDQKTGPRMTGRGGGGGRGRDRHNKCNFFSTYDKLL